MRLLRCAAQITDPRADIVFVTAADGQTVINSLTNVSARAAQIAEPRAHTIFVTDCRTRTVFPADSPTIVSARAAQITEPRAHTIFVTDGRTVINSLANVSARATQITESESCADIVFVTAADGRTVINSLTNVSARAAQITESPADTTNRVANGRTVALAYAAAVAASRSIPVADADRCSHAAPDSSGIAAADSLANVGACAVQTAESRADAVDASADGRTVACAEPRADPRAGCFHRADARAVAARRRRAAVAARPERDAEHRPPPLLPEPARARVGAARRDLMRRARRR